MVASHGTGRGRGAPRAAGVLAAGTALLGCGPAPFDPPWDERPPNVLLITIDTLRADHLGTYGYGRDTSPEIDALAEQGVLFENASSSSSWTLPGLASLLTGEHTSTHGCWTHDRFLGGEQESLGEHLLPLGYDTVSFTANLFTRTEFGLQQGILIDEPIALVGEDERLEDAITSPELTDSAIDFLRTRAASDGEWPWLLWVHYFDPHDTYRYHPGFSEPFAGPEDQAHAVLDLYDGEIRFTDHHIGRLLDALRESGLEDETLVVLTSDHGEEFLDHGGTNHGHTLHRELTQVPLILRVPGRSPRRVSSVVQLVDVLPTLLELVGAPLPAGLPGRSLVPFLAGEDLSARPALQELRRMDGDWRESLRDGTWSLIRRRTEPETVRLYDLARDPTEQVDVAAREPEVVARLLDRLQQEVDAALRRAPAGASTRSRELSDDELDALKGLGYLGER